MAWDHDHLAAVESLLFRSDLVKVGRFQCPATHPCFQHTDPIDNDVFVFVRSPLWLRRGSGDYRFIGPGGVLMHRAGTALDRRGTTAHGEHTYWFGLHPNIFIENLERYGLSTKEMGDALAADPLLRYQLIVLVNQLESGVVETLAVEETVLTLFDEICARRANQLNEIQPGRLGTAARRRRLADAARAYLDAHFTETIALEEVAKSSGASLYHLCRVFRKETGLTLHEYVTRQRLGNAVERMAKNDGYRLTDLALELGFSSHSHFSRVFNQQVGMPPSMIKAKCG